MQFHAITDWDDAYANADHIPRAEEFIKEWPEAAARFRSAWPEEGSMELDIAYGSGERNRLDLFLPDATPEGLVLFVHGGYWFRFGREFWSHLAGGSLARGYAVAVPSYSLCPTVRISDITKEVAKAIEVAAARVRGDIYLVGHSAGGHLVARMICNASPLAKRAQKRIVHTMPISCVSDLRPLCCLAINETLQLTDKEANRESPALLTPLPNARVTCWVGANERTEFLRQNALLANIWHGLGARIACVEESDRHHFDVIEGLEKPDSAICRMLFDEGAGNAW